MTGLAAAIALTGCAPAALVGGGAALTASAVGERSMLASVDDAAIKAGVQQRLGNRSGELFRDVFVTVVEGSVVLTGSVPRAEDRVAATEAAWATPGVESVEDALEVAQDSGTRAYLADVAISNDVRYALMRADGVRSLNFSVTTVDKVVHLTGLARTKGEIARAVEQARRVGGVRKVVSHVLTIDDPRRKQRLATG